MLNITKTLLGICFILLEIAPLSSLEIPCLKPWCFNPNTAPNFLSLQQTEGKGLGYSQGYTSLDLFLSRPIYNMVSFVDLRGHHFNQGRFATNAGLGLRGFNACWNRIWGINCFYDSFLSRRLPYHQVAFGLESLGDTWDLCLNGYVPIGHRSTPIYTLTYDFSNGFLAIAKEQFAMGGLDAEVGYHFCRMRDFDMYVGLGPYAYWGRSQETKNAFLALNKHTVGGRLRASTTFLTYFELEGIGTYDPLFNWGGQVIISLNIPFGSLFKRQTSTCAPCWVKERIYQPVKRNEIIVVDRVTRYSSDPSILNPENQP